MGQEASDHSRSEATMPHSVPLCVSLALFAAIAVTTSVHAQAPNGSWVLEKGQGVTIVAGRPPSLKVEDKQMSGSTGCNTFRATMREDAGNKVAISDVALTRKMCAPELADNERAIVQAFDKTMFIEEKSGVLTFLSGSREPLLVWKAPERAALPETSPRASLNIRPKAASVVKKRTTKAARKQRAAHIKKVSRKHATHRRAIRTRAARGCYCICPLWD
jgi:heat shock protein HslJ